MIISRLQNAKIQFCINSVLKLKLEAPFLNQERIVNVALPITFTDLRSTPKQKYFCHHLFFQQICIYMDYCTTNGPMF